MAGFVNNLKIDENSCCEEDANNLQRDIDRLGEQAEKMSEYMVEKLL